MNLTRRTENRHALAVKQACVPERVRFTAMPAEDDQRTLWLKARVNELTMPDENNGRPPGRRIEVLKLMADGRERTIPDVALRLGISVENAGVVLKRLEDRDELDGYFVDSTKVYRRRDQH